MQVQGALAAVGDQVALDVRLHAVAYIHVKGGAVNAVGFTGQFEASLDSTNGVDGSWFSVRLLRSNATTQETNTTALAVNAGTPLAYAWSASVQGLMWLRVRASALTSGDVIATINALG
ncbi:hypothetical protein [Microbacterium schleiferi]|uniref:Uncharacterized protein n=1 Tax=Microbacterium schleiferi TaxID=69362 RepID=A0ABU7V7G3_9MICO